MKKSTKRVNNLLEKKKIMRYILIQSLGNRKEDERK